MERKKILFLNLSQGGQAGERLVELIEQLDLSRFAPVVLAAGRGPEVDICKTLGVEIHERPLCACFVNACYQTKPSDFLLRPGVMLAVARYCGYVRKFVQERNISAVCVHTGKTRLIGSVATLFTGVPLVRPTQNEPAGVSFLPLDGIGSLR